jgi:hypothetical protein
MKINFALIAIAAGLWLCLSFEAHAAWRVGKTITTSGAKADRIRFLSATEVDGLEPQAPQVLRSLPFAIGEEQEVPGQAIKYEEVLYSSSQFQQLLNREPQLKQLRSKSRSGWPGSEVKTLVQQGPNSNRINLAIVGDGYTQAEHDKFFADAQRITDQLFSAETYHSYLPLFNVYAVFVPSHDSGITDASRKDTALKLYRSPSGSKRVVNVADTSAAERAIALAPACDFPILLANDDYYGGLGGRYAITTRSVDSGIMVLRHELGHNFGNVGEEYDGGMVYQGANFSQSSNTSWEQWATGGSIKVFEAKLLAGSYPWLNLSDESFETDIDFPADDGPWKFGLLVSAVGWQQQQDIEILLDSNPLAISGVFKTDRSFFDLDGKTQALPAGHHKIEVVERTKNSPHVLALLEAYAYPPGYDFTPGVIGAFATFDDSGSQVGYRPTHEGCLMREMRSTKFCAVDEENMWLRFLSRVKLVDDVTVTKAPTGETVVELLAPALSGLEVKWFAKNSDGALEELKSAAGQMKWVSPLAASGEFEVHVGYSTPEVRKPTSDFHVVKSFRL